VKSKEDFTKTANSSKPMARRIFVPLFLITELILYCLVHTVKGKTELAVSFVTVGMALVFALFAAQGKRKFICLALAFTLGADYDLVLLLGDNLIFAMVLFNIAQIFYVLELLTLQKSKRERQIHIFARLVFCVICSFIPLALLGSDVDLLSTISLIYYANLLVSAAVSVVYFKKAPFLCIGLLLFVMCDLFVGFGMLPEYFNIERDTLLYKLARPKINMSWVFYVPSQTMISLECVFKTKQNL
jgi:hypothetical protein